MDAQVKYGFSLCLALCLLCLATAARAQTNVLLEPNVPVEGYLNAGESQAFQFVTRTGGMLSFYVQAVDNTLDPTLTITTLDGDTLISNDDALYPTTTDALIEGFTSPRNGTYRLVIGGFGERNSGTYRLVMLPGYARLKTADSFSSNPLWQTLLVNTGTPLMEIDTSEGNLRVALDGIDQTGIVSPGSKEAVYQDYYARVEVNLTWRIGWVVGLALRYLDEQNYYLFQVNSETRWRFAAVENGRIRIIKDWSPHPALAVRPQFTLGALANGNILELFFQDELLGTITDESMAEAGRIGFFVGTVNRQNSQVVARFDNLIMTEPMLFANQAVFPQQISAADNEMTVRELQRRRLIPGGGTMVAENQRGTVQDNSAGISRIELIPGSYRNFVLGGTVYWSLSTAGLGGCGIAFRENDSESTYLLAFFDSSGGYGLAHRQPAAFEPGIFHDAPGFRGRSRSFVIIALADRLYYYVDGTFVEGDYEGLAGSLTEAGGISRAVVNFTPVNTVCDFQGIWLWSMD